MERDAVIELMAVIESAEWRVPSRASSSVLGVRSLEKSKGNFGDARDRGRCRPRDMGGGREEAASADDGKAAGRDRGGDVCGEGGGAGIQRSKAVG